MKNTVKPIASTDPDGQAPVEPASPRTIDSHQLLGNARECWIAHAGQTYRLCHTRNDKLILIK